MLHLVFPIIYFVYIYNSGKPRPGQTPITAMPSVGTTAHDEDINKKLAGMSNFLTELHHLKVGHLSAYHTTFLVTETQSIRRYRHSTL